MTSRTHCLYDRFRFVIRLLSVCVNERTKVPITHLGVRQSLPTTIPFERTVCGVYSLRRLFCASPILVPSSLFRNLPAASSRNLAAAMRPAIAWWLATHPAELGLPLARSGGILTTQSASNRHQEGAASLRCPCRPFVTAPALRETRAVTRCGVSQRSSERISTSLRRVIERLLGGARP